MIPITNNEGLEVLWDAHIYCVSKIGGHLNEFYTHTNRSNGFFRAKIFNILLGA